jgi:hypothetical protein
MNTMATNTRAQEIHTLYTKVSLHDVEVGICCNVNASRTVGQVLHADTIYSERYVEYIMQMVQ